MNMAESSNCNCDKTSEPVPDREIKNGLQKWNGGNWEKVSFTRADEQAEDALPMKVMNLMGFPKSYSHSLYNDFVEEVKEMNSLPSDTASSFYNMVGWICGNSPKTSSGDSANEISEEVEGVTASSDSILTRPGSRIRTPYNLSQTDIESSKKLRKESKHQQDADDIYVRLPSLVMPSPSKLGLPRETTVYSCEVQEDNPDQADKINVSSSEEPTVMEVPLDVDDKNVSQPCDAVASETDLYAGEGLVEKKEELETNDKDNKMNSSLSNKPAVASEGDPKLSESLSVESDPPLEPKLSLQRTKSEFRVEEVSTPEPSPVVSPSADVAPAKNVAKTTSQLELGIGEDLKSLQDIVKKLYKRLNKKGPLTVVAKFIPKPEGKLEVDIETTEDDLSSDTDNTNTSLKIEQRPVKSRSSSSAMDTESGETEDEYEHVSVKVTSSNKKQNKAATKVPPPEEVRLERKKSVRITEEFQKPHEKAIEVKSVPSKSLHIRQQSSTLLTKPSVSFVGNMTVAEQKFPAEAYGGKITVDLNNNVSVTAPRPPILKSALSKAALRRPSMFHFTPSTTASDFSGGSSGMEEIPKRPATAVTASYQNNQNLDRNHNYNRESSHKLTRLSPITSLTEPNTLIFRIPSSKSFQSSQSQLSSQSATQHQYQQPMQMQTHPNSWIDGWDYPSFTNMRVVKTCDAHEKNKLHPFQHHQPPSEQGDYVPESDSSVSSTDMTIQTQTEGEETATTTAATPEVDLFDRAINSDFDYYQQAVPRTASFLGASCRSRSSLSAPYTPPQTAPPMMTQHHQQKFKAPVYIPLRPGAQQRNNNSYRQMFKEKRNQQTMFVDLRSNHAGDSSNSNYNAKDSKQLGHGSQGRYGRPSSSNY